MKPFQKQRRHTVERQTTTTTTTMKKQSDAERQIGLFFFFCFFLHFKMPPCFHQTHISSSHLKRAASRGRREAEAGYSRDQETTFNFKSISRKTLRSERGSKYHSAFSSPPTTQTKGLLAPPVFCLSLRPLPPRVGPFYLFVRRRH